MSPREVLLVGGPFDGVKITTAAARVKFAGEVEPEWDGTEPAPVVVYDMARPDTFTYSGTWTT